MINDNALHEIKSKQISEIAIKLTMSFSIRRLHSHNGECDSKNAYENCACLRTHENANVKNGAL